MAIALGHCQDILATFVTSCASFYACHGGLFKVYITLVDLGGHGAGREFLAAAAAHLGVASLFSVKVVLPRLARNNLATASDLKALGK